MEKQLVRTITGREVPPGQSAVDVKCAVFNVATAYMVRAALLEGQPVTHRAVTVSGGAVARPRNLWVPIGTPLRCLLESAGGLKEEPAIILTGRAHDRDGPDGSGGPGGEKHQRPAMPDQAGARRCGSAGDGVCPVRHCVSSCPMNLNPAFVYRAMRMGEREAPASAPSGGLHGVRLLQLYLPVPYPPGGSGAAGTDHSGGRRGTGHERTHHSPDFPSDRPAGHHLLHHAGRDHRPGPRPGYGGLSVPVSGYWL